MYDPETYRQERAKLRAEIEANRTPEQKAEAGQIRAQRAAYEALPNGTKTELEELEVFDAFTAPSGIAIDPHSRANARAPEPDIRCTIAGVLHYFELGEIVDQPVARTSAAAIKYDEPRGTAFSPNRPFTGIIAKKRAKTYTTTGAPVDLVLYYRTQHAPGNSYFVEMRTSNMAELDALTTGGPFQRVWIFDFNKVAVLWHS